MVDAVRYMPDEIVSRQVQDKDRLIDPWTFLDYKPAFGAKAGSSWTAPTWVGEHHRRLQAYRVLEEYYRNASRNWLPLDADPEQIAGRREYGDAFILVEAYLNSVMGDDASIVVPEASGPESPEGAKTYLKALLEWATNDQFDLKSEDAERTSIKLGDAVYVLGWDEENERPTIEVWDPGFYFPVIEPDSPGGAYPKMIHLAYEYEVDTTLGKERYVRRHTYEMVELVQTSEDGEENEGQRKYAWNDKPSKWTVVYSVAVWKIGDIKVGTHANDLLWSEATRVEVEPTDLEMDFIPVVHLPCVNPGNEHFGISIFSNVLQLLDDIQTTDTDLQASGRITGSPPIAVGGSSLPTDEKGRVSVYGAGQLFQTGDGTMTMMDTSRSLDALLKLDDHQLSRLSVNSRLPESVLGRVKPSEVPSGIALTISFGPHIGVIKKMRKLRRHKYGLLFKFVGRLMLKNGKIKEIFPAEYAFGSFIPADRMGALDLVIKALTADPPAMSLETCVRMLIEAGFPIEDAVEEIKKIKALDYEGANKILDATGDPNLARTYLGFAPVPVVSTEPPVEEQEETPPAPTP